MPSRPRFPWLPRLLFRLAGTASAGLILLVLLAPLLDHGGVRLLAVFARDATMRRTALAGALGLLASACIFFRPQIPPRRPRPPRAPTPPPVAGA